MLPDGPVGLTQLPEGGAATSGIELAIADALERGQGFLSPARGIVHGQVFDGANDTGSTQQTASRTPFGLGGMPGQER